MLKLKMLLLSISLIAPLSCFGWSAPVAAEPTDPDDPRALDNVWTRTLVVFPQAPDVYFYRAGQNLDYAIEQYAPKNLPALIFLHGCSGLSISSTQTTKMIRSLAEAGFVVFAPNSLDRPRKTYCYSPQQLFIDTTSIPQRLGELRYVLEQIKKMDWIDQSNLFVGGHSLGGWTVTQWTGNDFRAAFITGATCQPTTRMQQKPGVQLPLETAVISLLGSSDEWFNYNLIANNCGGFPEMKDKPNRKFMLLRGVSHDVTEDPAAMPAIIEFLKAHASRPIEPVK
ncbi:MAG: dienelactone hydrolase family protein [Ferrovibrio sp.]|uniref:dienelactone hydrolase family protein n=1 Tax=Ferrovibrio sp. TaxID=1917215 RepID=UPI00391B601E